MLDFSIPLQTQGVEFNEPFKTLGEAATRRADRKARDKARKDREAAEAERNRKGRITRAANAARLAVLGGT